jgi:hypothetical protein
MSKPTVYFVFALAVFGFGPSFQARATTVTIGATAPSNYTFTTFGPGNSTSGPGDWTFGGSSLTTDVNMPGYCVDPYDPNGTGTTAYYACDEAGTTITVNFADGITGLDLLWGSPDGYNTLTFWTGPDGTGTSESFIPGVAPLITMGIVPSDPVLFVAAPGTVWDSVTFNSNFNAFEFANVATQDVPEPSTFGLLAGGLLLIVARAALRHRKSSAKILQP